MKTFSSFFSFLLLPSSELEQVKSIKKSYFMSNTKHLNLRHQEKQPQQECTNNFSNEKTMMPKISLPLTNTNKL